MKITAAPRSDQWNADDFVGDSKTFTIANVTDGTAEQPYDISFEGAPRVWRPPLTTLRILMEAWGDESDVWIGRRVTLYRDATVRFGKDAVGGIRVSHLSHLPGNRPLTMAVTASRGKRPMVTIQPLSDENPAVTLTTDDVDAATTETQLRAMWRDAPPGLRARITARVAELQNSKTDVQNSNTGGGDE